ncbi:MAG: AMP-binding protein [Gammaproteobacteria bacterium]|jgi:acyl-[acyl-carrier-protein]-phospholipid O-acyltransferase/long-chain-fatty-acid--[acyl-carrier-protein] ligase
MGLIVTPMRALLRACVRRLFRVRVIGLDNFLKCERPALIVANHVSTIDGLFLHLFLPETPTFVIDPSTPRKTLTRRLLRLVNTFEMDPANPLALKGLVKTLKEQQLVAIFPEGRVTNTGSLMKAYDAPVLAADLAGANILPVALEGLQYSRWSLLHGLFRTRRFPPVKIRILEARRAPLADDENAQPKREAARNRMLQIMREIAYEAAYEPATLYETIVAAMARHGPRRKIIEDSTGACLTYRQLLLRANVVGQFIAADTDPGDAVGIMLPSTAAAIITFTAALSRGRKAAMLNFTAGARGLVIAAETADVKVVYTARAFIREAGLEKQTAALEEVIRVVYLEDLTPRVSLLRKLRAFFCAYAPTLTYRLRQPQRDPQHVAVILFTSGSEGIPKGVLLTHSNIVANRAQVQTLVDLTHRDTVLNILPMFHAFGLLGGVFLPLCDGARIYCYPSALHYRVIPELSYKLGATCLFGTNTFLAGYAKHAHPYDFQAMRYVIAGAEKLTDDTRRIWQDKFGIRIFEGYGATEASPVIAVNTPMANKPETVGQLLAKMESYVEPVSGIASGGRLVVRGPNVMRGYLFHGAGGQHYPPSTDRGQGWYDTGDIVTVDADGFITIVGRHKRFAKIGGEMVSLLQTEELAQLAWPAYTHAAVALPDTRKGEQIVLLSEYPDCDRSDLVSAAKRSGAPELSIPKRVVYCEGIPLLGSGKTDYPALRELAKTVVGD